MRQLGIEFYTPSLFIFTFMWWFFLSFFSICTFWPTTSQHHFVGCIRYPLFILSGCVRMLFASVVLSLHHVACYFLAYLNNHNNRRWCRGLGCCFLVVVELGSPPSSTCSMFVLTTTLVGMLKFGSARNLVVASGIEPPWWICWRVMLYP